MTASSYDKLNQMMDDIDNFYEKLLREEGLSKQSTKWAKMRESITDGEYVAVMWIDQMWYRARVKNFVNHTELRVFYIDYGTTRVVRCDEKRIRKKILLHCHYFISSGCTKCTLWMRGSSISQPRLSRYLWLVSSLGVMTRIQSCGRKKLPSTEQSSIL